MLICFPTLAERKTCKSFDCPFRYQLGSIMQKLFFKPSPETKGNRLGRILTQHSLAAPTPTRKGYMCVFQPKDKCPRREWEEKATISNVIPIHQEYCFYDGYCTKETKGIYSHSKELILFLETVTQKYKLTDFEALFLLQFFRSNVKEACRQLCNENDSTKSTLLLSIDAPWQLQPKTICQQPGIRQFSTHTFFKNDMGNTFSKRPHLWRSILMQETFLEAAKGSCLRIQRTLYCGHPIQVACILASDELPFQVVGLRLPAVMQRLPDYDDLMNKLEKYIISLVSASKVWEVPKKKKKSTRKSDDLNMGYGSMQWHIVHMSLDGKISSISNDPTRVAGATYVYALLKNNKNGREKLSLK